MAQPDPYSLTYDFTAFQVSNPTTPLPADKIEVEYNNISSTITQILANLVLIQRDDGELANGSVGTDQLDAGILAILGAGSGEISTVAGLETEITALAALDTEITALGLLTTEIAALGAITASISAVAAIDTDVTAVANNITAVGNVGAIVDHIISVDAISSAISAVNANATNINTLAGLNVEITRLGLITGAISNVSSISDEVEDVASIKTDVSAVAAISADVTAVANIAAAVSAVNANETNINAVAANETNINAVAANETNINAVNANETNINAVAAIDSDVTAAAAIVNEITIVANNIATITDAAANIPQANRTATTDPTVNDDSGDGYSEASIWVNTTSNEIFFCADASVGAAVWVSVSGASTLATLADVSFTGLANNDFMKYNGSDWINRTPSDVRTDLGLVIGTNVQAYDAELAALAGLTSAADKLPYFTGSGTAALADFTAYGRSVVAVADEASLKALVNLEIGTDVQAYNANLTTYAGITPSVNVQSLLGAADYSAMRTLLGLVIGTNVQAYDAELAAIAGLTSAADRLPYFTGSGTAGLATFTSAARDLLDDADATTMRTTLGLVIGTNVQAYDAELAALAGLTSAANAVPVFTGSGTAGLITLTASTLVGMGSTGSAAKITLGTGLSMSGAVLSTTGAEQYLHVRDEKSTTTGAGDAATTTHTRTLNTVKTNGISGASLGSNQITLPAGTYRIHASAPAWSTGSGGDAGHRAFLYNTSDTATTLLGTSEFIDVTTSIGTQTRSHVNGVFTIASQKVFELRHYIGWSETDGLGMSCDDGATEVYAEVQIWKVA